MDSLLRFSETAYITAQNLMPLLNEYTNPHDLISRMVKKGELIRLKNGYYVMQLRLRNRQSLLSK